MTRATSVLAIAAAAAATLWAAPAQAGTISLLGQVGGLSITAPTAVSLGVTGPNGTIEAALGDVTVTSSVLGTWSASVSATSFVTGAGTGPETIPAGALSYWSGPATSATNVSVTVPGQLTGANAQTLGQQRTAFSATVVVLPLGQNAAVTWRPTVRVQPAASAVAGVYTGTITHTVA